MKDMRHLGARITERAGRARERARARVISWNQEISRRARSGQGTTEYAILVGVLVVIAIIAVSTFRERIQELWNAISDGINSL